MTLVITTEIKVDHEERTLNTLLNNNYLDLKPQEEEEDINDGLIEDKNNIEIPQPVKTQQHKELDILNY